MRVEFDIGWMSESLDGPREVQCSCSTLSDGRDYSCASNSRFAEPQTCSQLGHRVMEFKTGLIAQPDPNPENSAPLHQQWQHFQRWTRGFELSRDWLVCWIAYARYVMHRGKERVIVHDYPMACAVISKVLRKPDDSSSPPKFQIEARSCFCHLELFAKWRVLLNMTLSLALSLSKPCCKSRAVTGMQGCRSSEVMRFGCQQSWRQFERSRPPTAEQWREMGFLHSPLLRTPCQCRCDNVASSDKCGVNFECLAPCVLSAADNGQRTAPQEIIQESLLLVYFSKEDMCDE
eukprot:2090557-Amphidinium_carterae.1